MSTDINATEKRGGGWQSPLNPWYYPRPDMWVPLGLSSALKTFLNHFLHVVAYK